MYVFVIKVPSIFLALFLHQALLIETKQLARPALIDFTKYEIIYWYFKRMISIGNRSAQKTKNCNIHVI